MAIIQTIIASISAASQSSGGGGGGGGGGGPTYLSWTIEWWGKKISPQTGPHPRVFSVGYDATASIGYSNESGGDYIWTNGTLGLGPMTVGSITGSWHHWAIVSDSVNLTFYKDGVQLAQAARTGGPITDATTAFTLGSDNTSFWKGNITDFHIIKGIAKYTGNFTPPSSRITPVIQTVLLLPFTQAGVYDAGYGPNANSITGLWSTDNPYGDSDGSFQTDGVSAVMSWNGSSIFALDT